jgi:heavy metal sensor kinase
MKGLKTLRFRFALWIASLLFAAFACFGLFVYMRVASGLITTIDNTLRFTATQLFAEIVVAKSGLVLYENSLEDAEFAELRQQGLSMRILNLAGEVVNQYGPYQDLPLPRKDFTVLDQVGDSATIYEQVAQERIRVYTAPIVRAEQVVGTLQVAQNVKSIQPTLRLLLLSLLIAIPSIVLLASAGGYFLAARALAPIDKITQTARKISSHPISASDLSARLGLPESEDEVGRLAATFDSMLARLEQAFRREQQFTADASHELRTPLSTIQTIISSTLGRLRIPAEYIQSLDDLDKEVKRMRTLTEGLLQLAHSDVNRPQMKWDEVDLALLLRDVTDSLRPLAEEKGLQIIDKVGEKSLQLLGDSDSLIRLFVNLVHNAIQYTQHGSITVSAQTNGEETIIITVQDTGVGIPAEHLPHVFERFYRGDASRSSEGLGLGLAIATSIAHAHGGTIDVVSKVGEGTTFVVQLLRSKAA